MRDAWLAVLFGLGALVAVLAPLWSDSPWRLVWTSLGLTAVFFGVRQLSLRRRGLARGRGLSWLGIGLGSTASLLLVWAVLWTEVPAVPAPPQIAFAHLWSGRTLAGPAGPAASPAPVDPGVPAQPSAPAGAAGAADHSYTLRSGRIVPPAPNASTVEPAYQLQANLVTSAYQICQGLSTYRQQYGALPESLQVGGDGRISTDTVTFSIVLPAYMRLSYSRTAPDGTAYVTVADTESGMAMSCVRGDGEVWIANN